MKTVVHGCRSEGTTVCVLDSSPSSSLQVHALSLLPQLQSLITSFFNPNYGYILFNMSMQYTSYYSDDFYIKTTGVR